MICWYCHWGWSKPVSDIYEEAVRRLGGCEYCLEVGPSHVVWSDENFDRVTIQHCIDNAESRHARQSSEDPMTDDEIAVVLWSLQELLKLDDDVRECCPDGYDGDHPDNFPPKNGIEVVRH